MKATLALLQILLMAAALLRAAAAATQPLGAPCNLRIEGLAPASQDVVLSELRPQFSFLHAPLAAPVPFGVVQASYRLTVTRRGGAMVWDSGEVRSSNSSGIIYGESPEAAAGKVVPLVSFSRYT